jgi:hypothetical protein
VYSTTGKPWEVQYVIHCLEILFSSSKSCHDKEHKDGKDQNQREIRYLMMTRIQEGSLTEEKHGNLSGFLRMSSQHISWIGNGNSHRNQNIRWLQCVLTDQWRNNTRPFLGTLKHKEARVVYEPFVDTTSTHWNQQFFNFYKFSLCQGCTV